MEPAFLFEKVAIHLERLLVGHIPQGMRVCTYVSTSHVAPALDQPLATLARLFGRESAKGNWIVDVHYGIEPVITDMPTEEDKQRTVMKTVKMYEQQQKQLTATVRNLTAQQVAIEGMVTTNEIIKVMELSHAAMESDGIDLDHAEDVLADVQEGWERQAEIHACVSHPMDGMELTVAFDNDGPHSSAFSVSSDGSWVSNSPAWTYSKIATARFDRMTGQPLPTAVPEPNADAVAALRGVSHHLEVLETKKASLADLLTSKKEELQHVQNVELEKTRASKSADAASQPTTAGATDGETVNIMVGENGAITEGVAMSNETIKVMELSHAAMESGGIDLDHAEDVLADLQDQMVRTAEIADAISQPMDGGMMPRDCVGKSSSPAEVILLNEIHVLENQQRQITGLIQNAGHVKTCIESMLLTSDAVNVMKQATSALQTAFSLEHVEDAIGDMQDTAKRYGLVKLEDVTCELAAAAAKVNALELELEAAKATAKSDTERATAAHGAEVEAVKATAKSDIQRANAAHVAELSTLFETRPVTAITAL